MFFLTTIHIKDYTDGVTTTSLERWLTGLNKKRKRNAVVSRDNRVSASAPRQPTQKISILETATGLSMKDDLEKRLVFHRIVQTNLRPDIVCSA
ncbi:hypothetical protein DPMN_062848 [Dreissena polymorpha]|uniref:Uncharacterized protein n=1 Tax=Dreissena polymorpha TaxID=45954 RepID=A0A9D4C9E5_DREPO|nr:hypothetical protein DPMN_062848 [Dreissena polymorpha]